MQFEFIAGNLALDFANTVHDYGASVSEDDLKSGSELVRWARQAGLLSERESQELYRQAGANLGPAATGFQRSLRLRRLVYEVFSDLSHGGRPRPGALAALNSYFKQAMAAVSIQRVRDRYELGWEENAFGLDRVLWAVTRSAMDLLTSERLGRIRQCAGDTCTWLFLDTSRNGMRRWCDMEACGNRAKVRRFRQRVKTEARHARPRLERGDARRRARET
ncbi:MAG: CGNR zinc finger domain-containing protein [Acidobacteriia bacterium]|nr:CGNR zinc finger domain-containing protein [Terriglobia bacterium]